MYPDRAAGKRPHQRCRPHQATIEVWSSLSPIRTAAGLPLPRTPAAVIPNTARLMPGPVPIERLARSR